LERGSVMKTGGKFRGATSCHIIPHDFFDATHASFRAFRFTARLIVRQIVNIDVQPTVTVGVCRRWIVTAKADGRADSPNDTCRLDSFPKRLPLVPQCRAKGGS
jgi:hypothetical protein